MSIVARQTRQIILISLMREILQLAVALALWLDLVEVGAEDKIPLRKCCGVNEALNGDATACVLAPWPQYNVSLELHFEKAPVNESWLRRWVPPGVSLGVVGNVYTGNLRYASYYALRVPVRTSGLAKEAKHDDWRRDRVLFGRVVVYRRNPDGGIRRGSYCVDAALDPFPAPFALMLDTFCIDKQDCVETCCRSGHVLTETIDGSWLCAPNHSLSQSSVAAVRRVFDPEVPIRQGINRMSHEIDLRQRCPDVRRSTHSLSIHSSVRTLKRWYTDGFFSTTLSCVSNIVRADGTAEHVAVHCNLPRWSRAFYWCTRPLTFVSVLLLLAAEASILSSPRLRKSVHGWALGCHAGCLLAFNILLLAFYLSVSDDTDIKISRPGRTVLACTAFALMTYFFLTAASCWLTVICLNMSTGFKAMRASRTGRRKRRLLMLSAFAWGIPAALTFVCAYIVLGGTEITLYRPSLMETRTCFDEVQILDFEWVVMRKKIMETRKEGSAAHYYAPMAVLSVVNVICVIKTMLRVRFLTRGNSVLHCDMRQHYKINHREEETTTSQLRIGQEKGQRVGSPSGPKSVSVYIRLPLSAGVLELTAEMTAWACSSYAGEVQKIWTYGSEWMEQTFSYRAVGYLTDLMRAAIVLWLAAPDAGDLHAICRRLRRTCRGLLLSE